MNISLVVINVIGVFVSKMSVEYCHYCDAHIDTDVDAEHFDVSSHDVRCINEEQDREQEEEM